jgi:hypothetical protein
MASPAITSLIPINEIGMRLPPNHRQTTYRFMLDGVLGVSLLERKNSRLFKQARAVKINADA